MIGRTLVLAFVSVLVVAAGAAALPQSRVSAASSGPLVIVDLSPAPNATVPSLSSTISGSFQDSSSTVNPGSFLLFVNHENVTGVESLTVTTKGFSYVPPSILPLRHGNNTVTADVSDNAGNSATATW